MVAHDAGSRGPVAAQIGHRALSEISVFAGFFYGEMESRDNTPPCPKGIQILRLGPRARGWTLRPLMALISLFSSPPP